MRIRINRFRSLLSGIYALRKCRNRKILLITLLNICVASYKRILAITIKTASKVTPHTLRAIVGSRLGRYIQYNSSQARRYIRRDIDIHQFFRILLERKVKYVVLRWFDQLPNICEGEDLDILLDDRDVSRVSDLFVFHDNRHIPVDLYSVTGIEGTSYKSVPYYPPHLAAKILSNRMLLHDIYSVPSPDDYFLSLVYHVVFHKGEDSGLALYSYSHSKNSGHDYVSVLKSLSAATRFAVSSFEYYALFSFLQREGWVPTLDTLRVLSRSDTFLQVLLDSQIVNTTDIPEGLMVFVVRDWAVKNKRLDFILERLSSSQLDIVSVESISRSNRCDAINFIRGGKWDRGPYPVSGGEPAVVIVAYDYDPKHPSIDSLKKYPFIANQNILIKHRIRDEINAELPLWKQVNCLHSADDIAESLQYIRVALPDREDALLDRVRERQRIFATEFPVLETYKPNGTRSKTEKINFNGRLAVKKTFKLGCERFAKREIFAYQTFSDLCDAVPPLLAYSSNYIIIPWYENALDGLTSRQKKATIRQFSGKILAAMRCFYENGYAIIGFYPGNLIITPEGDLKIIDFEFIYKYESIPSDFSQCYDLAGIPADFNGDLPVDSKKSGHTYNNTWKGFLDIESSL